MASRVVSTCERRQADSGAEQAGLGSGCLMVLVRALVAAGNLRRLCTPPSCKLRMGTLSMALLEAAAAICSRERCCCMEDCSKLEVLWRGLKPLAQGAALPAETLADVVATEANSHGATCEGLASLRSLVDLCHALYVIPLRSRNVSWT